MLKASPEGSAFFGLQSLVVGRWSLVIGCQLSNCLIVQLFRR
jgi:hypothetical protein